MKMLLTKSALSVASDNTEGQCSDLHAYCENKWQIFAQIEDKIYIKPQPTNLISRVIRSSQYWATKQDSL